MIIPIADFRIPTFIKISQRIINKSRIHFHGYNIKYNIKLPASTDMNYDYVFRLKLVIII